MSARYFAYQMPVKMPYGVQHIQVKSFCDDIADTCFPSFTIFRSRSALDGPNSLAFAITFWGASRSFPPCKLQGIACLYPNKGVKAASSCMKFEIPSKILSKFVDAPPPFTIY